MKDVGMWSLDISRRIALFEATAGLDLGSWTLDQLVEQDCRGARLEQEAWRVVGHARCMFGAGLVAKLQAARKRVLAARMAAEGL